MPETLARSANARNNAMFQHLRMRRWTQVRDAVWELLDPLVRPGTSIALVGGGSCDDLPLGRLLRRGAAVTLVDLDPAAMQRASQRVTPRHVEQRLLDVTGGCADQVLEPLRDGREPPMHIEPPRGSLLDQAVDLVVGDLLYTQLLHAGLLALGIHGERQQAYMQRYDRPLAAALVARLHATARPGGHVLHLHDVACWTRMHPQPVSMRRALRRPEACWPMLRRHDACDPHLIVTELGLSAERVAWWRWQFEPRKQFLVRASLLRV